MSAEVPGENPTAVEIPKDSFRVQMNYNPEFLYTLLTQSNKSGVRSFDSNWMEISEVDYDPFDELYAGLRSDLKIKLQPEWQDRSTKSIWLEGSFWNVSTGRVRGWESRAQELQKEFLLLGEDLDLRTDENTKQRRLLVTRGANPSWALWINAFHTSKWGEIEPYFLDARRHGSGFIHEKGIKLIFPFPSTIDLNSPHDIEESLAAFMVIFEKTVRVLYRIDKKHLPLKNLVFEPGASGKEKTEDYLAICSYCNSHYSIVSGPKCPGCGASGPQFS
jgi:hypothetical protein